MTSGHLRCRMGQMTRKVSLTRRKERRPLACTLQGSLTKAEPFFPLLHHQATDIPLLPLLSSLWNVPGGVKHRITFLFLLTMVFSISGLAGLMIFFSRCWTCFEGFLSLKILVHQLTQTPQGQVHALCTSSRPQVLPESALDKSKCSGRAALGP